MSDIPPPAPKAPYQPINTGLDSDNLVPEEVVLVDKKGKRIVILDEEIDTKCIDVLIEKFNADSELNAIELQFVRPTSDQNRRAPDFFKDFFVKLRNCKHSPTCISLNGSSDFSTEDGEELIEYLRDPKFGEALNVLELKYVNLDEKFGDPLINILPKLLNLRKLDLSHTPIAGVKEFHKKFRRFRNIDIGLRTKEFDVVDGMLTQEEKEWNSEFKRLVYPNNADKISIEDFEPKYCVGSGPHGVVIACKYKGDILPKTLYAVKIYANEGEASKLHADQGRNERDILIELQRNLYCGSLNKLIWSADKTLSPEIHTFLDDNIKESDFLIHFKKEKPCFILVTQLGVMTLNQFISAVYAGKSGSFDKQTICTLLYDLMAAVSFIENKRYILLDMKIESCIISQYGHLKVIDLGTYVNFTQLDPDVPKDIVNKGNRIHLPPEIKDKKTGIVSWTYIQSYVVGLLLIEIILASQKGFDPKSVDLNDFTDESSQEIWNTIKQNLDIYNLGDFCQWLKELVARDPKKRKQVQRARDAFVEIVEKDEKAKYDSVKSYNVSAKLIDGFELPKLEYIQGEPSRQFAERLKDKSKVTGDYTFIIAGSEYNDHTPFPIEDLTASSSIFFKSKPKPQPST